MSNFKIGQKVVCVDIKGYHTPDCGGLKLNEIYTIQSFSFVDGGLILIEHKSPYNFLGAYDERRFRPLDHQFAEDVIAYITELELQNA